MLCPTYAFVQTVLYVCLTHLHYHYTSLLRLQTLKLEVCQNWYSYQCFLTAQAHQHPSVKFQEGCEGSAQESQAGCPERAP